MLPLREIAMRAQMPPSKVHLYLVSFIRENMAYQDAVTGYYGLGSFAVQLGLAAVRQVDVVSAAAQVLPMVRDETDCAIYLSLWGDSGPCIVAKADGNQQGAFALRLGYILPVLSTATGNAFLSYLPTEETAPLIEQERANNPRMSALSEKQVDEIAKAVRKNGYVSTIGRLNNNFAGIAAPVFKPDGAIAAVLTLLGSTDYVVDARKDRFRDVLIDAASTIAGRMAKSSAAGGKAD